MKTFEVDVGGKTYEVDAPDADTAWTWANQHHASAKGAARAAAEADTAKWAAGIKDSAVNDMGTLEKVRANIGSGMADLYEGAKQLKTDIFGTDAESAAAKRGATEKRVLDKALAEKSFQNVPGGKLLAQGLQVAGAVAPTLALPAGALPAAVRAIPYLGRVVPRAGLGALAADSAITGATYGAVAPVEDGGSRAMNVGLSAGMGAATPGAVSVLNAGRKMVTRAGGAQRAGEVVAREAAEAAGMPQRQALEQTMRALQTGNRGPIPLTSAAIAGDPALARLEAGSRTRNGANWYDFDQQQARAVSGEFDAATREAADIAQRRTDRRTGWDTRWGAAQANADASLFNPAVAEFRKNLDVAAMSPEASNPAVRAMLTEITNEIDRLGPSFSLGHLQQIRANLSGSQKFAPQNAYQGAPRDAKATRDVISEVDRILNDSTGGRWSAVTAGYAADSGALSQAKAASKVRDAYYDQNTGRVRGVAADPLGDVPKITEAGLGRAIDLSRGPQKQAMLSPDADTRLQAVLGALRQQNIVQGVKRSATAGGGSNTASDQMASRAAGAAGGLVGGVPGFAAATALRGAVDFANARRDQALAAALQNPQQMLTMIQQQLRSGQPLSPVQEAFLNAWRATGGAAAATQ